MGETVTPASPTDILTIVRSAAEGAELPTGQQENLLRIAKTLSRSTGAEGARLPGKEVPREVIAERYEVVEELGRGGMGVVYRAYDRNLRRDVALKVLLVGESAGRDEIERFHREARAAAGLQHPGIIQIHDVGESEGKPFYVMELAGGKELSDAIDDDELSPRDAIELTRQLAEALQFAHARGVLHRDMKPRNALVDWHGRTGSTAEVVEATPPMKGGTRAASACLPGLSAKLLDFGLAKFSEREVQMSHAEEGGRSLRTLTRSGQILGTPSYMSPEQVTGAADIDARTDIYSLGAALYEALTGNPPFHEAATLAELLYLIRNQDPDPPRKRDPDLDADIETICLKCLQKERKDRYQTAGELAEDCRRYLAGEPIAARPVGPVARVWKRAKRHKAVAIPIAALVVLLLSSGLYFVADSIFHALKVASLQSEIQELLEEGRAQEARVPAGELRSLEPEDLEVERLCNRVESEWRRLQGDRQYKEYLSFRDQAAQLAAEVKALEDEVKEAEDKSHHGKKNELWKAQRRLREEEEFRDNAFSLAVAQYTEAVAYWQDNTHARARLAELHWDRYLEAEQTRDWTGMRTAEKVIRTYAEQKYDALLKCEKTVRVTFLLPEGFDREEVEAYLYRYEQNETPPVMVPVPFDAKTGELLGEPSLPPAEPFPLARLESGSTGTDADLSEEQLVQLARRAAELIEANQYAEAIPGLMVLAEAVPDSAGQPYNLACCLAVGAAQEDPNAWLREALGEEGMAQLEGTPFAEAPSTDVWKAMAFLALEEAVRRGWNDADHVEADTDLEALRDDPRFELLLLVMRGDFPRHYVQILEVVPDSQAQRLGIQPGNVPVRLAGRDQLETTAQVAEAIQSVEAGQEYEVVLRRGSSEFSVQPVGGEKLGIQMVPVDLTGEGPNRFPIVANLPAVLSQAGIAELPEAGEAQRTLEDVRYGTVYRLAQEEGNRVRLLVEHHDEYERPCLRYKDSLRKGSYLLYFPGGQGLYQARYPFQVARDDDWDETCELVAEDDQRMGSDLENGKTQQVRGLFLIGSPHGEARAHSVPGGGLSHLRCG